MTSILIQPSLLSFLEQQEQAWQAVLFDIDGTLIRAGAALANAAKAIGYFRARNRSPFLLLTNDGNHSPEEKSAALRQAGIDVSPQEIISCSHAIVDIVKQRNLSGAKAFIMGDLGVPCYAQRAGLRTTRTFSELDECEGIIIGEAHYDWEPTFNAAVNFFIRKSHAFLLVPNPDTYWPSRGNRIAIGAGGKARFLQMVLQEYGVTLDPIYLGKPNAAIFQRALRHLAETGKGVREPEHRRILMVGDSLRSDTRGGNRMGFSTALVLTGITTAEQLDTASSDPDMCPTFVFRGF